jgi:hypothetical protein
MKRLRFKALCYVFLPMLVMSLLSACGTLTTEGIAPTQGGFTLERPEIVQPATTGESVSAVGCVGAQQAPTRHTGYQELEWDPSTVQIAASIAIGAVWSFWTMLDPWAEDMQSIGDGIEIAIAGGGW